MSAAVFVCIVILGAVAGLIGGAAVARLRRWIAWRRIARAQVRPRFELHVVRRARGKR